MAKSSASRDGGGGGTIAPLTNSTKLFLQRLLVAHVVTDDEAQKLYDSIKSKFAHVVVTPNSNDDDDDDDDDGITDHGYMGNNLDHCFGIINASLVPGFELEVRTVTLPVNNDNGNDGSGGGSNKRQKLIRYHCITNNTNDIIAKVSAYPISKGGPHEMAYFRLVIERIVERGNEILNDDDSPTGSNSVGCPGMLNKMELINLRTELDDGHKDKLSIEMTELALQCMIDEKWLVRVVAAAPAMTQQRGVDGDEDEEDDTTTRKKRKSSNKRSSSSSSLKGTYFGIGPRTFMECSEFLHKAGLASERMPQSILHRI